MESIIAEPRNVVGKAVKSLRKKGLLPAVVYGKGHESESISLSQKEFEKLWRSAGESTLITLAVDGSEKNVLIHDVALDPIKNKPLHVDFYLVDMKKEVEVDVPIEFVGEAEAGKSTGGILVKVMHKIKIKALPKDLPHALVVDVSKLQEPKDSFAVKDITVPKGVVIIDSFEDTVALIEEVKAEEVVVEPVSTDEVIKNIEVVKEKKPEAEEESESSE